MKFLGGKMPDEKEKENAFFKKKGAKEEEDEPETAAEALQRILVSPECPKARGFEHQFPMPMILNKDQIIND